MERCGTMSHRGSQKAQYNKLVEALLAAREALEKALAENALLEARLSTAADKQILLLNKLIDRDAEIERLRIMTDDARGPACPSCGEPLVSFATMNERECGGCRSVWPWQLKPGQLPLVANNRATRRISG